MLVFKRRKGESIRVGDVRIKISNVIGGTYVKLAVEGPREIQIDREEIYQDKRRKQE